MFFIIIDYFIYIHITAYNCTSKPCVLYFVAILEIFKKVIAYLAFSCVNSVTASNIKVSSTVMSVQISIVDVLDC